MESYISEIVLFNSNGNKRFVKFRQGVNIITGDSKTGKSAIVEIMDYCLCSRNCTIPKGVITDFTDLYGMIIVIKDRKYVIARESPKLGGEMYFDRVSNTFDLDKLTYNYFKNKDKKKYSIVQNMIEKELGLSTSIYDNDTYKKNKVSLRNMLSYLFQHQNLIANKFALFYRFNNFFKKDSTIKQFPVFSGFVNSEYYSLLIEKEELEKKLKKTKKELKIDESIHGYVGNELKNLLADYYSLIGKEFDNSKNSYKQIFECAINLPEYDGLNFNNDISKRYFSIEEELENCYKYKQEILYKKGKLKKYDETEDEFDKNLKLLKEQTEISEVDDLEYICPICHREYDKLYSVNREIKESKNWLNNELSSITSCKNKFEDDIRLLSNEEERLNKKIRKLNNELKNIKEKYLEYNEFQTKIEKINYAKAKIEAYLEISKKGLFEMKDDTISKLESDIKKKNEQINSFDLNGKMKEAEEFISSNMTKIAKKLDFEEEYGTINLKFDIRNETFDLYQIDEKNNKIFLEEMGSGANWVSSHISLFLSLLHFFAKQGDNSPIPLIMFFDQPSQVYFPNNKDSSSNCDLLAVDKIYRAIFEEIDDIEKDTGILPQIIIVDHVDGNHLACCDKFKEFKFNDDWRNGKALI